ncbi:hypothetical protein [Thermomonospora catenispora]|uniref:hypothetical protein n=1 Tax=Thermomonospora catenispora TaxID=2493090 RepID=UPI001124AF88|nr:hypothetical protein [Thermomonospora catenispora]TNY37130.1 hypothetical protein EIO00_09805 [Thermomonospora catenispora]
MRRWWSTGIAAVMLVSATACGGGDDGGGGGEGKSRAAAVRVTVPPGGWPQPVNGRVTERMCDLLTDADYQEYGYPQRPFEKKEIDPNNPDWAVCTRRLGGSSFSIGLRPSAELAKKEFQQRLQQHKDLMFQDHRQMILATDLVPGADESWFDYSALEIAVRDFDEYEILVRRGSLLFSIVLTMDPKRGGKDPKTTLVGLAQRVLQRLPGVGTRDTGQTPTVVYELLGNGSVFTINYWDPGVRRLVFRNNVKLPWRLKRTFDPRQAELDGPFSVSGGAFLGSDPRGVRCRILMNGRVVAEKSHPQFVGCDYRYPG